MSRCRGGENGRQHLLPWERDAGMYEESHVLGTGAYGTVWQATKKDTGQIVAMKKMRVPISDEGIPQSIIREISALKALEHLRHRNIAWLIDVCHGILNPNEMYVHLIFEKGDWDLYNFLHGIPSALPEHQIRLYAHQMLKGIDFLHSNNVIHRDLKPQNILINKDGVLKITDFGLARTYSSLSTMTTVVVTLWYRSPELLLSCSYASPVDVWSFGCILAELYLRTSALLPAQSEREQLDKIFQLIGLPSADMWPRETRIQRENFHNYRPIPLSQFVPNISPGAVQVLEQTLKFLPSERISAFNALKMPYFAQL